MVMQVKGEFASFVAGGRGFYCKIMASKGVKAYVANNIKHVLNDDAWDNLMESWGDT